MSRVWTGGRSQSLFLQRLAVVLAHPIRLKIVTELSMREMSPKQFFEEFGYGSISRVDEHFKILVKYGWLSFVRPESGGKRHGATEHFYRTIELAVIDNDTWAELPYSIQVEFSSTIYEQLAERFTQAMEAGTFDARADRHFTWTPVIVDQLGWENVTAALDRLFEALFEEQTNAKLRIYNSGEASILTTVALGGFESPQRGFDGKEKLTLAKGVDSPYPFMWRVSKVFADKICLKIVAELNLRAMSAIQFYREFGGASKAGIYRRFKMLSDIAWLAKVDQKDGGKRRGAREQFYRATGPVIFDKGSWLEVPDAIRTTHSWTIFEQFSEQFKEAMEAGTVDARPDRHLSWSLLRLDQLGWENAIAALDAFFDFIFEEQTRAESRSPDEEKIRMTVFLAGFESSMKAVKAP